MEHYLTLVQDLTFFPSFHLNEISSKLRNYARLIIEYRNLKNEKTCQAFDMIDPSNWDDVILSVKSLVNYEGDEKVGIPTLLLSVGRSLSSIACAKRALGIKLRNQEMQDDARAFLDLHDLYWNIYAKHADATMASKKDKTPELLPLTSDLQKLRLYLVTEIDKILNKQSLEEMTLQEWSTLQKLTITRIITFNARRGSEPLNILVTDWERCLNDEWKRTEDIAAIDDPLEKLLADRLKVLYVKGKKRRRVPVLFTTEMQQSIILLNAKRDEVGVDPSNKYLFPRPTRNSRNAMRGWDVVHEVSNSANLAKPDLVTSTKVRKHMATILQLLDINSAELTWITDHLGHSIDVHKNWYRQEESTIEVTKVAKILVAKDAGENFTNKKISEIGGLSSFIFFQLKRSLT